MTHENKFGMFIHWGIYALTGLHEQAIARYDLDREYYEGLAKKFDPADYDPEAWVLLAKKAGMKYICITAKHHDGFCMWQTDTTDYSIKNSPYKDGKGDIVKELSEEELAERKKNFIWTLPAEQYPRFLRLFVKNVGSMAKGGIWE